MGVDRSRRIGEIFLEKGLVTAEQLELALEEQRRTGKRLGEVLVELGAIERLAIADALGMQWRTVSSMSSGAGREPVSSRTSAPVVDGVATQLREERDEWRSRAHATEREAARLRLLVAELDAALAQLEGRASLMIDRKIADRSST
jgi:hypothetical protein